MVATSDSEKSWGGAVSVYDDAATVSSISPAGVAAMSPAASTGSLVSAGGSMASWSPCGNSAWLSVLCVSATVFSFSSPSYDKDWSHSRIASNPLLLCTHAKNSSILSDLLWSTSNSEKMPSYKVCSPW